MKSIFQKRTFGKRISSPQIIALGFLAIILVGALLLMLPVSSNDNTATPFTNCFFTATSATCVTGLITYDTLLHWSFFGRAVIILLIQTGGLGFVTLAALFSVIIRRNLSLKEKMTMTQSLSIERENIARLIKRIVTGTFLCEAAGGIILSLRFAFDYSLPTAIYRGFFISVSAFCNAGFDVFGDRGEFSSLSYYAADPTVVLTVSALILIGGLGFFVWADILKKRRFKTLELYSKVVVVTTVFLFVFAAVAFLLLENGAFLSGKTAGEKVLDSVFFSATLRTAGFATFDFSALKTATLAVAMIMMFIGGGSGSTAGGIKVSTAALLVFAARSALFGRKKVTIGKKTVSSSIVLQAAGLFITMLFIILLSGTVISEVDGVPFVSALFEAFSAAGTVGLTVGITPTLSAFSLWLLSTLMFFGRVGILTVIFALSVKVKKNDELISYPETKYTVG
mgnify:CR=1 FL=1